MIKSTTVERYKTWCKTAKSGDKFHWQGKGYTKKEFDALHFGGETSTKDIKEKDNEELETRKYSDHIKESGDGTGEG